MQMLLVIFSITVFSSNLSTQDAEAEGGEAPGIVSSEAAQAIYRDPITKTNKTSKNLCWLSVVV